MSAKNAQLVDFFLKIETLETIDENLFVRKSTSSGNITKIKQHDYHIATVSGEVKLKNSMGTEPSVRIENQDHFDTDTVVFDPLDVCTVQIDEVNIEDQSLSKSNIERTKNAGPTKEEYPLTIFDRKFCKNQKHDSNHENQLLDKNKKVQNDKTKIFTCNVCNKISKQKSDLEKHLLIHYGNKPFTCDICKKSFNLKTNLTRHMLTHTGEKPYVCDVCKKVFRDKSNLNAHKLTHSAEKPYSCDRCSLSFKQKQNLIRHQRTHIGYKPFVCNVCDKAFTQKSSLLLHKRIHTGEKPYTCDICTKSFSQKTTLIKHIKIHNK